MDDDNDEPTLEGKVLSMKLTGKSSTHSDNPLHSSEKGGGRLNSLDNAPIDLEGQTPTVSKPAVPKSLYNLFGLLKFTEQELKQNESVTKRYEKEELAAKAVLASKEVAMEGYLTKRGISRTELVKDPWERRYFVLNYRGQISYYKNRQEFREDPKARIKGRPIELEEYLVAVQNTLSAGDTFTIVSGVSASSATGAGLLFQITPVPKEENLRHWIFKCDTEEMLNIWLEKMKAVSPTSFSSSV